jgi:hypothetical protein
MSLRKRQCALMDADTITFARLESDLDSRYLETDAVLRESGCADEMEEMQRERVKIHATRGMYIEFFDAKVVPFAFHDAGNATWMGLQSSEISLSDGVYTVGASALSTRLSITIDRWCSSTDCQCFWRRGGGKAIDQAERTADRSTGRCQVCGAQIHRGEPGCGCVAVPDRHRRPAVWRPRRSIA